LSCSAILLRPTRLGAGRSKERNEEILKRESMSEYELQMDIKRRMRLMLENEEKVGARFPDGFCCTVADD
jgi:hypothetical protein